MSSWALPWSTQPAAIARAVIRINALVSVLVGGTTELVVAIIFERSPEPLKARERLAGIDAEREKRPREPEV